jgi:hypothetical protein
LFLRYRTTERKSRKVVKSNSTFQGCPVLRTGSGIENKGNNNIKTIIIAIPDLVFEFNKTDSFNIIYICKFDVGKKQRSGTQAGVETGR